MERHFTEQQVSEIIRRAAERQAKSDAPGAAPTGISESELRRVARELGIDETALTQAMGEVGATALSDTGNLRSFERTLERVIDGEVPEESLASVVEEFVPVAGLQGSTVTIGRAINYTAMAGMGQCNINVAPRNGKTVLRVKSNAGLAFLPTGIPGFLMSIFVLAGVGKGMETTPLKFVVMAVAVLFIWAVAAIAFRAMVVGTNKKVLELTNRAAAKLSESAAHLRGRLEQSPQASVASEQDFIA